MSKIVVNGFRVKPMSLFVLEDCTDEDLDDVVTLRESTISKDIVDSDSVTQEESADDTIPLC